jgi:hypothetical protein
MMKPICIKLYNKYNFTQAHTTSATKEELHNHYDETYLYQTRRSDYGKKEREKYSLHKKNVFFLVLKVVLGHYKIVVSMSGISNLH